MTWSDEGDLRFGEYLKPGQELKYLNNDSSHPPHCFKAITKEVFGWLASLTLLTNKSRYKPIKDLYPQHHRALKLAGLAPKYVSTLQEVLDLNIEQWEREIQGRGVGMRQAKKFSGIFLCQLLNVLERTYPQAA
jgi:hypothetical protein